jgi:hypothetical protein
MKEDSESKDIHTYSTTRKYEASQLAEIADREGQNVINKNKGAQIEPLMTRT